MPFTEVADRVWVAPQPWCDVNVSVVGGAAGLVVVDTSGSTAAPTAHPKPWGALVAAARCR